MAQKAQKSRKKGNKSGKNTGPERRRERRFSTSLTHLPVWVALIGMLGCFALGSGVFGMWIMDEPLSYASYLVAVGGFGLGIALWFGQPAESAVSVGDSGIAVDDGRGTTRVPWFDLRSLRVAGGRMIAEGKDHRVTFSVGANKNAASVALKEAAQRVPDVIDVERSFVESLPSPDDVRGLAQDVENDQIAGARCASSDNLIHLEEDARLCPRCGQIYHRQSIPNECVTCDEKLEKRLLRA